MFDVEDEDVVDDEDEATSMGGSIVAVAAAVTESETVVGTVVAVEALAGCSAAEEAGVM